MQMPSTPSAFRRSPALPQGRAADGIFLLPTGMVSGEAAAAAIIGGHGWPIADGPLAFTSAGIVWREGGTAWIAHAPYGEMVEWSEREGEDMARHVGRLVRRIGAARAPWGGVGLDRPRLMGIVNVTPDSFSDGGEALAVEDAVARGLAMAAAGADIIDVGGESTRPGAAPVPVAEELARVLPVVGALADKGIAVSIDTRHAEVMGAAVAAGARIINDVGALRGAGALEAAAASGAAICLMHMQGEPRTMQAAPGYACAPLEVYQFLAGRVAACEAAGIGRDRIAVDPGIGFGKTATHNAQALATLALLHGLGCAVLLGASRKSFVAHLSRGEGPRERLPGTLAAHLAGLDAGAQVLRVHDVAETAQAVAVWRGMRAAG
ncbi:dihydropteroate synthase [Magnetospirillum sp. UT-4]|uniref:dihydropteroate synthase n=1 Tax=Magnetospirillum sp. UT-4 TaxID=2681467 RepID=UPI00137E1218|nr:dihydropteroate synthase [Magnetospirillum sp. UT-4]CAA7625667.1 Dihydropteroate synthase [Magnetospirillum sp. UT-4]